MKLGKIINYKITIEPSQNNGFIVKIGCGKFVAENVHSLLVGLDDYLKNPGLWEKEYNNMSPDQPEATIEVATERPEDIEERV